MRLRPATLLLLALSACHEVGGSAGPADPGGGDPGDPLAGDTFHGAEENAPTDTTAPGDGSCLGGDCQPVDRCAVDNGGCGPLADFTCIDNPGAPPTCVDIDVCLTDNGGCSLDADCTDLAISRTCRCKDGFTGDGFTCVLATGDCATNNGGCDPNATCADTSPGHTCTCNPGYTGNGTSCSPVDCGALSAPANGSVTTPTTTYTSVATYACHSGYNLTGTSLRACQSTGLWSDAAPTCTPVDCGSVGLVAPRHGSVSFTTTTYGSSVTYACNPLFVVSGAATRSCQASGTWSGTPPTCVPTNPPLSPFIVDGSQPVVVMLYETWYGRDAASGYYGQTFHYTTSDDVVHQRNTALPVLTSPNMPLGYDSADENVIRQHALWFQEMGVDAVLLDMSNGVSATFSPTTGPWYQGDPATWTLLQVIKNNIQNLYEVYDDMRMPVRIIGMLGAQEAGVGGEYQQHPDPAFPTRTTLELALQFYYDLSLAHPNQVVLYDGKPLVAIFIGPMDHAYLDQVNGALATARSADDGPLFTDLLTLRFQVGFTDSIDSYWTKSGGLPVPGIASLHIVPPGPPVWSFLDRMSADRSLVPAYSVHGGRPENLTVTMGFVGLGRAGYNSAWGRSYEERVDRDGFRYNVWIGPEPTNDDEVAWSARLRHPDVLQDFMCVAYELRPTFLLVSQFNEFVSPDMGWNEELVHDIEPTDLWTKAESIDVVAARVQEYKSGVGNSACARLYNVSTLGHVGTGADVLIGGFTIGGGTPKTVLITGVGPRLADLGVGGTLTDPVLDLYAAGTTLLATNDEWGSAPNAAEIAASGMAPFYAVESALLVTLSPGGYTAVLSGKSGGTGMGQVNVTEIDHPGTPLTNLSARGFVGNGDSIMTGGFLVAGATPKNVLIRAAGPSLQPFFPSSYLADPTLTLFSGATPIASNDNWGSASNAAAVAATFKAPAAAAEPAILIRLAPGLYTVQLSGSGSGTGISLLEVFGL